jgi:hypothetical protein
VPLEADEDVDIDSSQTDIEEDENVVSNNAPFLVVEPFANNMI